MTSGPNTATRLREEDFGEGDQETTGSRTRIRSFYTPGEGGKDAVQVEGFDPDWERTVTDEWRDEFAGQVVKITHVTDGGSDLDS